MTDLGAFPACLKKESKYLAIALFSNLQIFVISIPILIIVGADPSSSLFIRAAVIFINDFAILAIIFGNLIYSVHFLKDSGEISVTQAIRNFTTRSEAVAKDSQVEATRRRSSYDNNSQRVDSIISEHESKVPSERRMSLTSLHVGHIPHSESNDSSNSNSMDESTKSAQRIE